MSRDEFFKTQGVDRFKLRCVWSSAWKWSVRLCNWNTPSGQMGPLVTTKPWLEILKDLNKVGSLVNLGSGQSGSYAIWILQVVRKNDHHHRNDLRLEFQKIWASFVSLTSNLESGQLGNCKAWSGQDDQWPPDSDLNFSKDPNKSEPWPVPFPWPSRMTKRDIKFTYSAQKLKSLNYTCALKGGGGFTCKQVSTLSDYLHAKLQSIANRLLRGLLAGTVRTCCFAGDLLIATQLKSSSGGSVTIVYTNEGC